MVDVGTPCWCLQLPGDAKIFHALSSYILRSLFWFWKNKHNSSIPSLLWFWKIKQKKSSLLHMSGTEWQLKVEFSTNPTCKGVCFDFEKTNKFFYSEFVLILKQTKEIFCTSYVGHWMTTKSRISYKPRLQRVLTE